MKLYKIIFLNSMMIGTIMAISSYSWFSMWMGLEINLLSIIPLFSDSKNIFASEASLKYFITQTMASMILLMSVILLLLLNEFIFPQMNFFFLMMMNSALLTKLGAAPFHFWFPEVMEGLNWTNCFILLTWQKITPMILIMNNSINQNFLVTIIVICLIVSMTMAMNQISLRKILAFSSINHMAWMLTSIMISYSTWLIYFSIYSMMNMAVVLIFFTSNSFYLNQIINIFNFNKFMKFSLFLNFLSLGGLPPFIGFFPKWIIINWLTKNELFLVNFMLILLTLVMLYVYMRIMFSSLIMSHIEPKIINMKLNSKMLILLNFFTISSMINCTLSFNFF